MPQKAMSKNKSANKSEEYDKHFKPLNDTILWQKKTSTKKQVQSDKRKS